MEMNNQNSPESTEQKASVSKKAWITPSLEIIADGSVGSGSVGAEESYFVPLGAPASILQS